MYILYQCYWGIAFVNQPQYRTSQTIVSAPSSEDLIDPALDLWKAGIPTASPGVSAHPGCMELKRTLRLDAAHRSVSVTCARLAKA